MHKKPRAHFGSFKDPVSLKGLQLLKDNKEMEDNALWNQTYFELGNQILVFYDEAGSSEIESL